MIKRIMSVMGHKPTRKGRLLYNTCTPEECATLESMRGELDLNGYNLTIEGSIVKIERRQSVFGHTVNGTLLPCFFQKRSKAVRFLNNGAQIVELPIE